jgi:hypothetical protein
MIELAGWVMPWQLLANSQWDKEKTYKLNLVLQGDFYVASMSPFYPPSKCGVRASTFVTLLRQRFSHLRDFVLLCLLPVCAILVSHGIV